NAYSDSRHPGRETECDHGTASSAERALLEHKPGREGDNAATKGCRCHAQQDTQTARGIAGSRGQRTRIAHGRRGGRLMSLRRIGHSHGASLTYNEVIPGLRTLTKIGM